MKNFDHAKMLKEFKEFSKGISGIDDLTPKEIKHRKDIVDFGIEDVGLLKEMKGFFHSIADDLVDRFYEHIYRFKPMKMIIDAHSNISSLTGVQKKYFLDLVGGVDGGYGVEYFKERFKIEKVHNRINLGPKYYIRSYATYYSEVISRISQYFTEDKKKASATIMAFLKITNIDIQIAMETYIAEFMELDSTVGTLSSSSDNITDVSRNLASSTEELSNASTELTNNVMDISERSQ
ncbi:protoglobin domain-containing protein [Halonatronum saccharophilum]|uniref:protoglobin domain-containing protein n=1 Tax=Halonatronum saccharophilum TaxID=150060 RepID=UPI0004896F30|nr:protoglobin domain-containing protein [Halonatronum saccharophilum]